jgi:selenocysteine lyase/cysteine desulfurase
MSNTLNVDAVRQQFPALQEKQVYFDNAGGSQTLKSVIESYVSSRRSFAMHHANIRRISKYLSSTNVQLGASYSIGQASTKLFNDGVAAVARYINASPEEVVLGPST